MNKIIISLVLFLFALKSFSQDLTSTSLSKDYYLQKSKKQNTWGWVIVGTGAAIAAVGGFIQLNENSKDCFCFDFTGAYIAIGGGVVALSSVPLFLFASKNKKKAASIGFIKQKVFFQQYGLALKPQPAIALKIEM